MDERLSVVEKGLIYYYDSKRMNCENEGQGYFTATLIEDIKLGLKESIEGEVIKSLMNDFNYKILEDEDDKEIYLEDHMDDRYDEIVEKKGYEKTIYNNIIKYFNDVGYDCYEGDFFPGEGRFISLHSDQIAFIKRENE